MKELIYICRIYFFIERNRNFFKKFKGTEYSPQTLFFFCDFSNLKYLILILRNNKGFRYQIAEI